MDIEELIKTIEVQDFANAETVFGELMALKLNDALDAEKVNVASDVFGAEDNDDYEDDEGIELSDKEVDDLIDDYEDDSEETEEIGRAHV